MKVQNFSKLQNIHGAKTLILNDRIQYNQTNQRLPHRASASVLPLLRPQLLLQNTQRSNKIHINAHSLVNHTELTPLLQTQRRLILAVELPINHLRTLEIGRLRIIRLRTLDLARLPPMARLGPARLGGGKHRLNKPRLHKGHHHKDDQLDLRRDR